MVVGLIGFILGGICGMTAMAFVQAHRVLEFNEKVRLWEETHILDKHSDLIKGNKNL